MLLLVALCAEAVSAPVATPERYPAGSLEFHFWYRQYQRTQWSTLDLTRTIKGDIPLYRTNAQLGKLWCPSKGGTAEVVNHDLVGQGTLHGIETGRIVGGQKCRLRASFSIDVEIRGLAWWKPEAKEGCSEEIYSISYKATHKGDTRGEIRCRSQVTPMTGGMGPAATVYETGLSSTSETIEFPYWEGMTFEVGGQGAMQWNAKLILHTMQFDHPHVTKREGLIAFEAPPPDPKLARRVVVGPPLSEVPYGIPPRSP